MNEIKIDHLNFPAHYIENVEVNHEIASDCKLRSKFVHERIFQSRTKDSEGSVVLTVCKRNVKVIKPSDQALLSSYPTRQISYSACDKTNRLLALVVRSSEVERNHVCHIFRVDSSEQAESINRYFGSIFKQLRNKKKHKNEKSLESSENSVGESEHLHESTSSPNLAPQESESLISTDKNVDERLRRISRSNIEDLVSEKHFIRRHSLCLPSDEMEDLDICDPTQPLHPSLEKKTTSVTVNNTRPLIRRKTPGEYKGNRISAVIERLSFRVTSRDTSDILKSGSPVVALKEQLEYEEGISFNGQGSKDPPDHLGGMPRSNSKRQLLPSHPSIATVSDSPRKNSAPLCGLSNQEQPPVPPVRIHSLRGPAPSGAPSSTTFTPMTRRALAAQAGLKTPSVDEDDPRIYCEPPQPSTEIYRDSTTSSSKPVNQGGVFAQTISQEVHFQYIKNFSKEEAMRHLLGKEIGSFVLRHSGSHRGCVALSVKVRDNLVSHYIIQQSTAGIQLKGMDKLWPNLHSLITHLSIIPEILPCPLRFAQIPSSTSLLTEDPPKQVPKMQSSADEYNQRMKLFLDDVTPPVSSQDQYQQLSDFSSVVATVEYI